MNDLTEIFASYRPFKSLVVEHALHKAVLDDLSYSIESPAGYEFIAVIGPTGVGKTTLAKACAKRALHYFSMSGPLQPGELPAVMVTAPAPPPHGRPDWRQLFSKLLEVMNKPAACAPRSASFNVGFEGNPNIMYSLLVRGTTQGFRWGLCDAIRTRKTKLIIIDEAQHLTRGLNVLQVSQDMDNLKNLAQETECLLVLFGTYDLLPILDANDQLCRRVLPIHYPRYRETAKGRKYWDEAFDKFVEFIPLKSTDIIQTNREYFFKRTLGCIGTLDSALTWLAWRALRTSGGYADADMVRRCTLIPGCSRWIQKAILKGEAKWKEMLSDSDELNGDGGAGSSQPDKSGDGSPKPRPGHRLPGHDPVGKI